MIQSQDMDFVDFIDKCIEWKTEIRMTPEAAFSHPFISKAVNELKCLRTGSQGQSNGGNTSQQSNARVGNQGGSANPGNKPATGGQAN